MIQISLVIKLVMAQQVLIQISLGLVYEATNASFQISLVLTLVKTHQGAGQSNFIGYYAGYSAINAVYSNFIGYYWL
jgi:hypothetical protein